MLQQRFIEPVLDLEKADIAPSFLVRKKATNDHLLVHDDRAINKFIPVPKMTLPSFSQTWKIIPKNAFLVKIDLKNGYWNLTIHPAKCVRFVMSLIWSLNCLSASQSTAPNMID
jgi:hypothetical protein